ncbi:LapA family protein [Pseudomonas sp. F(2018)]|uniref:LapA family protein n=1 Tax=Pseudomonas sp. F(2018) TaxID=2502240 RepID=UPI0035327D9C
MSELPALRRATRPDIKRVFLAIALLVLAAAIFLLVLQNPQPAHLVFLRWSTPDLPLSVLLVLAFSVGLAVCLLSVLWLLGRMRFRIRRLERAARRTAGGQG